MNAPGIQAAFQPMNVRTAILALMLALLSLASPAVALGHIGSGGAAHAESGLSRHSGTHVDWSAPIPPTPLLSPQGGALDEDPVVVALAPVGTTSAVVFRAGAPPSPSNPPAGGLPVYLLCCVFRL